MRPGSAPGQAPCRLPTWYRCCASSGEASSVTCCSMNSLNVSGVDFFMCLQPTGAGGGTEWAAAVGLTAAPRRHCACPRPIPHQTTADAEHAVATPMTCWAAQPLAGTDGAAACPVLASGGGGEAGCPRAARPHALRSTWGEAGAARPWARGGPHRGLARRRGRHSRSRRRSRGRGRRGRQSGRLGGSPRAPGAASAGGHCSAWRSGCRRPPIRLPVEDTRCPGCGAAAAC